MPPGYPALHVELLTTGALTFASGPITIDADSPVEGLAMSGTL